MKEAAPSMKNGYNMKVIRLCLRTCFQKWFMSPRIPVLFLFVLSFGFWTRGGVASIAKIMDEPVSPWLLPHYFANPLMMSLFGFLVTFLFNDAPFYDHHTAFVLIRSGRKNWIVAKVLYVVIAAFLNALCWLVASLLPVLGRLQFTSDWGKVMISLANGQGASIAAEHDIPLAFFVSNQICDQYSGPEAMLLSFLLLWFVGVFLGFLIFCFNAWLGNNWGVIASGILSFLALFSTTYFIYWFFGNKLLYFSPVNWCSLYSLATGENISAPSLFHVFLVLSLCICGMIELIGKRFQKHDILL